MILSGQSIRERCLCEPSLVERTNALVSPFNERTVHRGMSFGLSVAGYDVRVAQQIILPPGRFSLASTMERFHMPADLIAFVKDKSTWARRGLAVQNTVIEPGWSGYLTMELTNHGNEGLVIEPGMPIAQIIFQMLDKRAERPYTGKYQNQESGPVAARMEAATAEAPSTIS